MGYNIPEDHHESTPRARLEANVGREGEMPRVSHANVLTLPADPSGLFIAFDGIDGSGKGTLIAILEAALRIDGRMDVLVTKQPGGSNLGDEIRKILFETIGTRNIEPDALELLFLANHIHNMRTVVDPAIAAGKIVVADRHWPSAIAYMEQRGADPVLRELYLSYRGTPHDVLFLLVGEPEVLLNRARARVSETHQSAKKWNSVEAMTKVQQSFIANFGHLPETVVVDTTNRPPAMIIQEIVLPRFGFKPESAKRLVDAVRTRHRDLTMGHLFGCGRMTTHNEGEEAA